MGSTPSIVGWCNVLTGTTMHFNENKEGGASSRDLKVGASAPQEGENNDADTRLPNFSEHVQKNRAMWEASSDEYEQRHGAARWSIALAERGARPVGLDISSRQLQHARHHMQEAGVDFPLVEASAEDVPLPDAS